VEATKSQGQISVRASLWAAGLYGLALVLIYHETTWSMIYIWSRSDTFAHGFLILPISIWLIWTRRDLLVGLRPRPAWWVALLIIFPGMAWLLAWLVDVAVGQQLTLIAMLIAGAWAIMGHRLALVLAFPLFFLFFAVPMGEALIAPMMEFTATSTVWLIKMTGIPVYREGLLFSLPSGSWSVVEACSGVRYIIASVTVGVLYAYLTYRSWTRRILFVVVSAIVPVFANTLRAYIIVMLGHLSDMRIATGADHLVYGWVFFGIVIFIMFWLGSFFREDITPVSGASSVATHSGRSSGSYGMLLGTLLVAIVIASTPHLVAYTTFDPTVSNAPGAFNLPPSRGEWAVSTQTGWRWKPPSRVSGQRSGLYEREGEVVKLFVQFADGTVEREDVIGSSSIFALEDSGWSVVGREKPAIQASGSEISVDEALIRGGRSELLVWSWYLLGEMSTSNDYEAKMRQTIARLGLGVPGAYRIILATPVYTSPGHARSQMRNFVAENIPTLFDELRRAAAKSQ
jgi:exosortase A